MMLSWSLTSPPFGGLFSLPSVTLSVCVCGFL